MKERGDDDVAAAAALMAHNLRLGNLSNKNHN